MKKKWETTEVEYLTNYWNRLCLSEFIISLDRTADSITRKARRLNLNTCKKEEDKLQKNWKLEEDTYLIDNYGVISNKEISVNINRGYSAISKRAKVLKISNTITRWNEVDIGYLEEKWGIVSVEAIAKTLKRSRCSILIKAWHINLRNQATASGVYLTPPEVSTMTGICLSTLYSYIKKDKIKYKKFKTGNRRKYQISPISLLVYLEKYKDDWNAQDVDIPQIKSYFSSYVIISGQFIVKNNIPEWFINKVIQDRMCSKTRLLR